MCIRAGNTRVSPPHRAGLGPPERAAGPADQQADAVDRAVDQAGVEPFPEHAGRDGLDRLDDDPVVDLVDVVLVQQEPVDRLEGPGDAVRRLPVPQPEVHRDEDAGDGDAARDPHQYELGPGIGMVDLPAGGFGSHWRSLTGHGMHFEGRLEERLDPVAPAQGVRHAHVPGGDRSDCQQDQRDGHRPGSLVRRSVTVAMTMTMAVIGRCGMAVSGRLLFFHVRRGRRVVAALPVEGQEHEAEHVGRRQQRGQHADEPEQLVPAGGLGGEGLEEDFVLAEEPCQAGHAGNRQRSDEERPVGDRQVLLQAAHVPEILLSCQRVDDGAGSEEEQGLEERVGVEMEDTGPIRADAHRQEHEPELRHRRVGEDALDVVLDQADRAGHQRRRHANRGHHP
jgi:hypothetical protein